MYIYIHIYTHSYTRTYTHERDLGALPCAYNHICYTYVRALEENPFSPSDLCEPAHSSQALRPNSLSSWPFLFSLWPFKLSMWPYQFVVAVPTLLLPLPTLAMSLLPLRMLLTPLCVALLTCSWPYSLSLTSLANNILRSYSLFVWPCSFKLLPCPFSQSPLAQITLALPPLFVAHLTLPVAIPTLAENIL